MSEAVPLLELARGFEHLVIRSLGIKANPPDYSRQVNTIADVLLEGWRADSDPLIELALEDMAALVDLEPNARKRPAAARRILESVAGDLGRAGANLPQSRIDRIGRALGAAYRLGLEEVAQPLGWSVDFELPDADALAGLHDAGLFWVGNFYRNHLTDGVLLDKVRDVMLKQGRSRRETGDELRRVLEAHTGKRSEAYWTGLAATVATRARSFGAISAMQTTGAVTYEYVNPLDERTSDVCRALDGTTFTVKGSAELRERFLRAGDPEAVKAIAPWPKARDLERVDGTLLSGAELQAKGIAWPPLHFHCRSSIDVATWGPMPDATDALGDVDVGQRVKPPKAGKPSPAKATKPGAVATVGTPWETAKASLDAATNAAKAAGLNPDLCLLSEGTRDAVRRHLRDVASNVGGFTPTDYLTATDKRDRAVHRSLLVELRDHLARKGPTFDKTLAERVTREIDLLDGITVAYRDATRHAPRAWREAERRKWARMLRTARNDGGDILPSSWSKAKRKLVEDRWFDALNMYDADILRILASEGERTVNSNTNRASAAHGRPGWVIFNMNRLADEYSWIDASATVAHEWGHRLDGVLGGTGGTGLGWKARPGYPDLPELWHKAYGDPFEGAKAKGLGLGFRTTRLPIDEVRANHYWTGSWVNPYEARIYWNQKGRPPESVLGGSIGGPVEYIAMAATYQTKHTRYLLERLASGRKISKWAPVKREGVAFRLLDELAENSEATEWRRAVQLYGAGYRDGLEELYGGGSRLLSEIADLPDGFAGDGDVIATALLFEFRYGVPLERSIGKGGILARHLAEDPGSLAELRKRLPPIDVDRLGEWSAWKKALEGL